MALAKPVSSSTVMKTNPLAVPGRWRTITTPATRARRPCGTAPRSAARVTPWRSRAARAKATGCGPIVRLVPAKSAVSSSSADHLGQRRLVDSRRIGSFRENSGPERPSASTCQSASRRVAAQRGERADLGQARAAPASFGVDARRRSRPATRTAPRARASSIRRPISSRRPATERRPRRTARPPSSRSASHPERVDVDGADADAVADGVAHQRRRMIKAHRPVVEQRAEEGRRVVGLEVGRGVGDERERRRVRLGEAVERERLDPRRRSPPAAAPVIPFFVIPARRSFSMAFIRSCERLKPIARRSSSA